MMQQRENNLPSGTSVAHNYHHPFRVNAEEFGDYDDDDDDFESVARRLEDLVWSNG